MEITRKILEETVESAGNIELAAKKLGISRSYAYRKAKAYGITVATSRKRAVIDEKRLIEEFNKGTSIEEISNILSVSVATTWRRIEELQMKRRKEEEKVIDKEKCIKMLAEGCTNDDIAKEFNCCTSTIKHFIKKNNLRGYRKKKVTKSDVSETISLLRAKGESVKFCADTVSSKTKKECLYGGKCGGYDCCDYLVMTRERRKHDLDNPQICHCYVHVTEAEKRKIEYEKSRNAKDILVR